MNHAFRIRALAAALAATALPAAVSAAPLFSGYKGTWQAFDIGKAARADDPRTEALAISLRRFPLLFTGSDKTLSISSVVLMVVPSEGTSRVAVPDTLQLSPPGGTTLQPPSDVTVGSLSGKAYAATAPISVTGDEDAAKWTLALPQADVAELQNISDLLLIFNYTLADALPGHA